MRYLFLSISLFRANFYLFFCKIFNFKNIKYKLFVLFDKNLSIRCSNRGKLILGKKVSFQRNVELISNGGIIEFCGNNYINSNSIISSHNKIIIGKNTTIGPNVLIYDHDHNFIRKNSFSDYVSEEITIGENVWIGAGCIILKGVHIGDNVVIAAGTVVTNNIPSATMLYQKRDSIMKNI